MTAATPRGFRDILPREALARERITGVVRECFSAHGYLPVETPLLEDRRVIERGARVKDSAFQLFDSDGSLLMLRPDLTLPVARLVAGRVSAGELPARFRYAAPVVREEPSLRGQPRQFTQLGVELVGEDGAASEVEVVRLLAEALGALEVPDWRIVFGSVTPLTSLLDACAPTPDFREEVLALVHDSDLVTLDELISSTEGLAPAAARALREVCRMGGGAEVIGRLDALLAEAGVDPASRGTAELSALAGSLADLFEQGRLSFDFSIINSFDYYTGIIFKGYAEGIAASLASGGRYDAVLANLGRPGLVACGFALSLERLQEVLGEPGESGVVTPGVRVAARPIRIAVPKGSLFKETVAALAAAGLPTGGCRFVVAEPRSRAGEAERNYAWRGTVRVATKYPRITQGYYDSIGQQVDIVTLHGNIELGPIVGMADRIVDITATGTTLAENDLVVVDEVMECTARFFAGPAAYRCDKRIRDLARRLAEVAERGSAS